MIDELLEKVRAHLTPELLHPNYRDNPKAHCYVASEAIFHLLGGSDSGYKPQIVGHEGGIHWYLRGPDGEIVDATADQFETPPPYDEGRGCGFLTKFPSRRARVLLDRMR